MRGALLLGLSAAAALRLPASRSPRVRMLASEDLSKFTVVQLKEKLRAAGLPVSGRKAELIDRLSGRATAPAAAAAAPAPSAPATATTIGFDLGAANAYPPIIIEACKQ